MFSHSSRFIFPIILWKTQSGVKSDSSKRFLIEFCYSRARLVLQEKAFFLARYQVNILNVCWKFFNILVDGNCLLPPVIINKLESLQQFGSETRHLYPRYLWCLFESVLCLLLKMQSAIFTNKLYEEIVSVVESCGRNIKW